MCGNCRNFKVSASPFGGYPVGCCDVQEGYYCIWTLNHATMECEEWAELCDLRSILHTISHITFNVVAERARARTALMNLRREAPFGECKRFPWRKTYVNVSCSVYSSLLQDILSSLDFKDRETEKELRYGSGHKQDDKDQTASGNSSLDDSKTRFRNTLVKFQNALCKKDEVYDRIKFEQKYNLRWCLGPCPSEPEGSPGNPDNPNFPKRPTYGDMMKAMRLKGLSPLDFNVFKSEDIAKGDFVCDRETQSLGPDMSELKLPKEATRVFIFARAEYNECGDEGSEVQGYIYDIKSGVVNGPIDLKKYSSSRLRRSRNILKEFEEVRLTKSQWEAISRIVKSSSSSEDEDEEGSVIEAII